MLNTTTVGTTSKALYRVVAAQLNLPQIRFARAQQRGMARYCRVDQDDELKPRSKLDMPEEHFPKPKIYEHPPSMWEKPDCCEPPCDVFRHDISCLKETPKKYTRTWNEGTEIVKMVWDCKGEIEPPEMLGRTPVPCPSNSTACKRCPGDESNLGLMKCKYDPPKGPCPKVRMPCCAKARDPPTCPKVVIHKCCQKRCTMYPAYSECDRKRPPVRPPTECKCLKIPSMCEVYEQFRRFAWK